MPRRVVLMILAKLMAGCLSPGRTVLWKTPNALQCNPMQVKNHDQAPERGQPVTHARWECPPHA
jgi:hypothetical protein